jgi:HEAT repeat protein
MIRMAGRLALLATALSSTVRAAPLVWPGTLETDGRALASVPDAERPDAIAGFVAHFGVAAAAPWLRPLLGPGPAGTRLYVARLLVGSGDAMARAVVLGWLTSPHALPNERALSVDALSWSPGAEDLRGTFEQAARDRDGLTRGEALDALARLDPPGTSRVSPSLPVFLGALDDSDRDVRLRAVHLVARAAAIDPRAVVRAAPLLLERLDDPDRQVRVAALGALGRLRDPRTVTALVRVADGDPPDLQVAAIDALGWPGNDAAVAGLEGLLSRRPADEAARHAARALGSIATPAAVRALLATLRVAPVLDEVGRALAAAGPAAVDPLARELAEPNVAVAARAIAILARIGDARALPPLARAARQRGGGGPLALAAVEALARLGASDATPVLAEAAEAAEPEIRRAALAGLAATRDARAVAVLDRGLADADPAVRAAAIELAARLAAAGTAGVEMERAADRIADALADGANEVRLAAARALLALGAPRSDTPGAGDRLARALASITRTAALARDPQEREALGDALTALARDGDGPRLDAAFLAVPDALVFGGALAAAHARDPLANRRIIQPLLDALGGDAPTAAAAADALAFARLSDRDAAGLASASAVAEPAVRARLCGAVAALPHGADWLAAWAAPDQPPEVRAAAAWAARRRTRVAAPDDAASGPILLRLVDAAGTALAGRWVRIGGPDLWVDARSDGEGRIRVDGLGHLNSTTISSSVRLRDGFSSP